MGNSNKKGKRQLEASKFGDISFKVDKSSYKAGDTISGNITINLLQAFPGNILFLKFKGKEVVHIVKSFFVGTVTQDAIYSQNKNLLKQEIPLKIWENAQVLQPGQYEIPFSIAIPLDVPSSFYQQGFKYVASIYYQLEAFLQPHNKKDPKPKFKQNILIQETLKNVQDNYSKEINTNLHTMKLISKGSNKLRAAFSKNYFSAGEAVKVAVELNNSQSQLNNKKITLKLKQKLSLTANYMNMTEVFTKAKCKISGVPAGALINSEILSLTLPSFLSQEAITFDLKKPQQHKLLTYSEDSKFLSTTTKSSLISSEYFLEVSCKMEGLTSETPKIEYPIQIYHEKC